MKSLKLIILILVIFLKTGNNLSADNLFFVNNIEIAKKTSNNIETLANEAIKKGFRELINKVLLKKDEIKLNSLQFSEIKDLISYYQIIEGEDEDQNKIFFNISFDKDKLHTLFYNTGLKYSDISQNELYLLPIFKKDNQLNIFTNNYFYENWNKKNKNTVVEFILPIENIEVLQILNINIENLYNVKIREIFSEYNNKNLALIIIEENESEIEKIFLKTLIVGKKINKSLKIDKKNLKQGQLYEKIIFQTKEEIVNLVKSQNLIDIRTPSFMNVKLMSSKKNNLVELSKRLQKIDLIENIFVQELNTDYVNLKIKYLGKINKIIEQLKNDNIILEIKNDQWIIELI